MRRYETIFIVTPDSPEEDLKAVSSKFQGMVASMDGVVTSYEEQGKKRLAYSVKKQDKGYYVLMDYLGSSDLVTEIERNMRLDDRILKYLTVKLADKVDPESVKEQAVERQEAAESAEVLEPEETPSLDAQETEVEES
jgi:small subunit ribosomal protein S6